MWTTLPPVHTARCHRRRGTLAVALIIVLAALSVVPALASGPPLAASGAFTQLSFVQTNVRIVGGATLFTFTETDSLSGTFNGTSVIDGACVVRPSQQAVCQAVETFTGTVVGSAGTVVFRDVIVLDLTTNAAQGSFTIVSGTGDLATLHGHGTFQGAGGSGTYAAQLVGTP
jgi:Protein of unknown function (DUF3224)